MKSILLLQLFLLFVKICNGSNILLLTPLGSKSHLNAFMGMTRPLAERGHQLTVVSTISSSKSTKNIRHVILPSEYGAATIVRNLFTEGASGLMRNLLTNSPKKCVDGLSSKLVQDLKEEKFDLILLSIFLSECYLSLVHHFKVPLVYLSPAGVIGIFSNQIGNSNFISLSGSVLLEGTFPFGYFYRLKATLLETAVGSFNNYYTSARSENLCRQSGACPPDMPSFQEIRANTSIVIANSVRYLRSNMVPDMPHIIYAGGSHCVPAKPLPEDVEKWVQGAGEAGFIYFSLGSVVTPSDMPESARKIFINVFGKLRQRVLWKWDQQIDNLPSNVKLGKWLPQQDILAHPKLRLFISHGGFLSILESTYHGARILGMPLYGDQYNNIAEGAIEGWAEKLLWADLTEASLERKIYAAMNNREMDNIVAQRAKIMNDLPRSPKEEVVFWIEYVIRHKGAPHLRSPFYHIPLYVLYNADVWLTIVAILVACNATLFFTLRAVLRRCFYKSKTSRKKKKNKKQ